MSKENILENVKYLHILWHNELKFSRCIIKLIIDSPEIFDDKEHLFISPHKEVIEGVRDLKEINYVPENKLLSKYSKEAKWIFIHSLDMNILQVCFIRRSIAKKIIWRTWGHDMLPVNPKNHFYWLKKVIFEIYKRKVRQFYGIGVANDIDVYHVENMFGKVRMFIIPYTFQADMRKNLNRIEEQISEEAGRKQEIRILVGHSGFREEGHIEILRKLKRYIDYNIKVVLVLSYGHDEYIETVKKQAVEIFSEYPKKLEIVEKFMEYWEYTKFLANMDIAIFNQPYSSALGNLGVLLYFGKKIYLNPDGDIYKSFERNGLECFSCDEIGRSDYKEFVSPVLHKEKYKGFSSLRDEEEIRAIWKANLEKLK